MKNIILSIILLLPIVAFSQKKDKKVASKSSDTKELKAAGFSTIYKHSDKNIISASIYFRGGNFRQNASNAGIENLTLQAILNDGTKTMSKDDLSKKAESLGARFSATAQPDYSSITMTCPVSSWNEAWILFQDIIMQPAFNKDNFSITKEQILAGIENGSSDPDTKLSNMSQELVYKNTPYQYNPEGTKAILESIDDQAAKNYYSFMKNQSRMYGVVVGKVEEADIIQKYSVFASIPTTREAAPAPFSKISIDKMTIDKEQRDLATNYMAGIINAPDFNTKEATAMRVAFSILSDRYFSEIRTKRNLSYAPAAYFPRSNYKNPTAQIYVTTTDPNQCAQVMIDELKKIKTEGFTEKELINKKETFLTSYFMRLETNSALDNMIGSYNSMTSWTEAAKYMTEVQSLTKADLDAVFKKYVTAIHWIYLGDTSKVDESIFLQPLN